MIIFENYNTCVQRYGKELTDKFVELGISPNYLLSACRFHNENNVPFEYLASLFKEWHSYVIKNNYVKDVNKIPYEKFREFISVAKLWHSLPNVIIYNKDGAIGRLYSVNDARNIPVKSDWCIKARGEFQKYLDSGDELYAIYLPSQPHPFTFNISIVHHNGKITYWNSANRRQENFNGNNNYDEFENKLSTQILEFLHSRANKQKQINKAKQRKSSQQKQIGDSIMPKYNIIKEYNNQNNCNRNMRKNKQIVRLTEGQLHNIIAKSVKRVLRESDDFIGHGYKTTSNLGGNEIQISNNGDAARLKLPSGEITDWLEIEFDEEGVAYITTPDGDTQRLDEYMRFY